MQLLETSQRARRRTGGGNGFGQSGLQGETFRDVFDTGRIQPVQPGVCFVANSVRVDEDLEIKRTKYLNHDGLDVGPFEPAVLGAQLWKGDRGNTPFAVVFGEVGQVLVNPRQA